MKRQLVSIILIAVLITLSSSVYCQNFFIRVIDSDRLQPIADARITIESDYSSITLFTAARGEASTNLSFGRHTLKIQSRRHEPFERLIVVSPEEAVNIEIALDPLSLPHERDISRPEPDVVEEIEDKSALSTTEHDDITALQVKKEDSYIRTNQSVFLNVELQAGKLQLLNFGIGALYDQFSLFLAYSRGSQAYGSNYFRSTRVTDILFNQASINAGYLIPLDFQLNSLSFEVMTSISVGGEFVNNNRLLTDNSINALMNYFIVPKVSLLINYQRFDFIFGLNYCLWLSSGMTDQRYGLKSRTTNRELIWSEDLFSGRKGVSASAGLRVHLFNY